MISGSHFQCAQNKLELETRQRNQWMEQTRIHLFGDMSLIKITSGLSSWWSVSPGRREWTRSCPWAAGGGCRRGPTPPAACWEHLEAAWTSDPPSVERTSHSAPAAVHGLCSDMWRAPVFNYTKNYCVFVLTSPVCKHIRAPVNLYIHVWCVCFQRLELHMLPREKTWTVL